MTLGSRPCRPDEIQQGGSALTGNTSVGVGIQVGAAFSPSKLADGYTKRLLVLHFYLQL